ncbi:MAG: T9SS type A sorting domain-containing protein [Ignavibacteriae bacterium]|nr:T9SS type A sorting domain-containing protein [Ignavibacteriota bacterium]
MFNLSYGITDTVKALKVLGDNHFVIYNVELVNGINNKVIDTIDEIVFDKKNINSFGTKSYKVDTQGLGEKSLILRLAVKTDLEVTTTTASIEAETNILSKQKINIVENISISQEVINEFALFQNYPNPFNPTTTISYQIPKDGSVTLKIYDALGKEITTLVNGEKLRGKYSITFDASNLTSGIYFYSLTTGSFKETKKLILIK